MKWFKRLMVWAGFSGLLTLLEHGFRSWQMSKIPYAGTFMEAFLDQGDASIYVVMIHVFGHSFSTSMNPLEYLLFKWLCFFVMTILVMTLIGIVKHLARKVIKVRNEEV